MRVHRLLVILLFSITNLSLFITTVADGKESGNPADIVLAFNKAMTDSNLEALLATLAPGGIQYTVKASHMGQTPDSLTTDLKAYWTMIAPVIFSSTESYTRTAKIIDSRNTETMATVWADVETVSVRSGGGGQKNNFEEITILIHTEKGWKIAGIMDTKKLSTLTTSNN
ncbi:MAG: nuclear transport factor 2 family protein [Gammaproteobacteria bacterium]|nr:nuclear transport factor 2 family protein [Gammaproteobacteria bacterium]